MGVLKIRVVVEEAETGVMPRYEERDPTYGSLIRSIEGDMEHTTILNDARSLTIGVTGLMRSGLSWAQAQSHLAMGNQVTRHSYRDGVRICLVSPTAGQVIVKPQFAIWGRAGEHAWSDWRPQTDDLFAGDWLVVPQSQSGTDKDGAAGHHFGRAG